VLLAAFLLLGAVGLTGCGEEGSSETTTGEDSSTTEPGTETTEADDGGGEPAADETFELRVAHYFPGGHPVETELVQPWGEAVSEATGGNVTITSYAGGTLLEGPEIYEGITKGVADVGVSAYGFNQGRFPVVEAFMLPGTDFGSAAEAAKALAEGIEILNPEELQDTHHLLSFSTGPGLLLMKETPVKNLDDLQGLEIAATSGIVGDALKLLGATPVVMPVTEVYEAQSRGVVQGVESPYAALKSFKIVDVTGYITETPFLYRQHFFMVMNKDKWESMPAEYQDAITEVTNQMWEDSIAELFDRQDQAAMDLPKVENEIEITTLSEEETAKWMDKISPISDQYQAKLDERGLDGEMILNTVKELADKHNE